MDDLLQINISREKVFNENAASIATFFGGPLGGAWIIGHNYKVFGQRRKMLITWLIAILLLGLTIAIALFVPSLDKVPNIMYAMAFTLAARQTVRVDQKKEIFQHLQEGGLQYKTWIAALIGLGSGLVLLALIFAMAYLAPELFPDN